MKNMCDQIKGDDYNNPLLWQYERIDEICNSLKIDIIDTPLQRKCLAVYLEDIYKSFDDYLINKHPEAFIVHRNNRYSSDMEYHALHKYLKINSFTFKKFLKSFFKPNRIQRNILRYFFERFTQENVNKFIEIDNNDRNIFEKYRDEAESRYFGKYGSNQQLNYSNYDSKIFEKYKYKYNY
jgi:hypothetical protein